MAIFRLGEVLAYDSIDYFLDNLLWSYAFLKRYIYMLVCREVVAQGNLFWLTHLLSLPSSGMGETEPVPATPPLFCREGVHGSINGMRSIFLHTPMYWRTQCALLAPKEILLKS
ncbi:hypothetical protein [Kosakonia cowanii]|uniref:hypothetical protein n=1 Tax=Kosakonia cowanii TaxID=208223 RepID=UPI004062F381